ncbi:hypothetical protein EJ06DRAFT_397269 [Trichodelitschia bisporula]|uniref:EthD domain-containing protein n=1 Tax=Trichodelitschia bisporula TaxID=703511 RepID=A0A6G1HXL2_9PEZI|nr:hypothetical protein EJ06DRAFT_397269 [Trichodelitschia bisporula]
MPAFNLHLIALKREQSVPAFLAHIRSESINPLVQARPLRWIILPTKRSQHLLAHNIHWDVLLILPDGDALSSTTKTYTDHIWSASVKFPAALSDGYAKFNSTLLNAPAPQIPPLSGKYPVANELADFHSKLPDRYRSHPVSMLNFLAFHPNKREQYSAYGTAFRDKISPKYETHTKLMGHIAGDQARAEGWDEMLLVHQPSLRHFATMADDDEYHEINQTYRLGALKDTFILCVVEVDDDGEPVAQRGSKL